MLLLGGYLPTHIPFEWKIGNEVRTPLHRRTGARVNAMVKGSGGVGMFESDHRYNRCINVFS